MNALRILQIAKFYPYFVPQRCYVTTKGNIIVLNVKVKTDSSCTCLVQRTPEYLVFSIKAKA